MRQNIQEWTKQNLWETAFKKFEEIMSVLTDISLQISYKGCLPQVLLGPFLNTLSQITILVSTVMWQ